jgi:hypothetical protein
VNTKEYLEMIKEIDCNKFKDFESFHSYCKEIFEFPDFYGMNMNAFIDCLSYIDEDEEMSSVKLVKNEMLILNLIHSESIKKTNFELYETIIDSLTFVNLRRTELGEQPIIELNIL